VQNIAGETALCIAAHLDNHRMVRLLVEAGADIQVVRKTQYEVVSALNYAIKGKSKASIAILTLKGAKIIYTGESKLVDSSPLFLAIRSLNQILVETMIINCKQDVTSLGSLKNSEGLPLIHFVLRLGSQETVEYFCKYAAYFAIDLNGLDTTDYTPLMRCIFIKRDYTLAARLIEYGADVNKQNLAG
jgi:ankyrin repeat protein